VAHFEIILSPDFVGALSASQQYSLVEKQWEIKNIFLVVSLSEKAKRGRIRRPFPGFLLARLVSSRLDLPGRVMPGRAMSSHVLPSRVMS
jgi:hypothetical protein